MPAWKVFRPLYGIGKFTLYILLGWIVFKLEGTPKDGFEVMLYTVLNTLLAIFLVTFNWFFSYAFLVFKNTHWKVGTHSLALDGSYFKDRDLWYFKPSDVTEHPNGYLHIAGTLHRLFGKRERSLELPVHKSHKGSVVFLDYNENSPHGWFLNVSKRR